MNKTYVFGDIHGCHQPLRRLLANISPNKKEDTLIFLGDYINRGACSKDVISELIQMKNSFSHMITLMGNHEQIFLSYLHGYNRELFFRMGGAMTLESYGITEPWPDAVPNLIPSEHLNFFNELMFYWEDNHYIYVHGGVQPGVHLSQQSPEWLLWAREKFINSKYNYQKRIIYGHTPFENPKIDANKIGIDTGLVFGGKLSCLILPDLTFIDEPASL